MAGRLAPNRETTCFCLLGVLIALYMLAGAVIFSSLESPAELQAHQLWERRLRDFSHEHKISCEDLKHLLCHYEEARTVSGESKAEPFGTSQVLSILWEL
uniref:Uncharacterized protein n=1 Tax=Seriola lalandi dorsalis TaxID=1841481 RepID=A0A3B4WDZ3_SERLL